MAPASAVLVSESNGPICGKCGSFAAEWDTRWRRSRHLYNRRAPGTSAGLRDQPAGLLQRQQFDLSHTNARVRCRPDRKLTDDTIRKNLDSDPLQVERACSVLRDIEYNGNDGTSTRFGWERQNKSLMIFAGEAYNVEMNHNEKLPK